MKNIHAPGLRQSHREFMHDERNAQIPLFSQLGIHRRDFPAVAGEDDNCCWLDVLTWGQKSRHANGFEIQWNSPNHLRSAQILLPLLESHYSEVLWAGEISIHFNSESAEFYALYFAHYLPLCPTSYRHILNQTQDPFLQGLARLFGALENISDCRDETKELHSQLRHLAQQQKFQTEISAALTHYNRAPLTSPDAHSLPTMSSAVAHKQIKEWLYRLNQLLESQHYRLTHSRSAACAINQHPPYTEIGLAAAKRLLDRPTHNSPPATTFIAAQPQTINTNSAKGEFSNEHI